MTDQTPEREPLIITLDLDLAPNPDTIRHIVEGLARATARPNEQTARTRFRNTARTALAACLNGDDDRAAAELNGLDDAQLYALESAGSALALHASRLRKPPGEQMEHADCTACGTGTADTHGDHAAPDWRSAYDRLAAQLTAAYRERDELRQRAEKAERERDAADRLTHTAEAVKAAADPRLSEITARAAAIDLPTTTHDIDAVLTRLQADIFTATCKDRTEDMRRELGNLALSALRWMIDYGLDPAACLDAAETAQHADAERIREEDR